MRAGRIHDDMTGRERNRLLSSGAQLVGHRSLPRSGSHYMYVRAARTASMPRSRPLLIQLKVSLVYQLQQLRGLGRKGGTKVGWQALASLALTREGSAPAVLAC